jgi:hypothetical protein
MKLIKNAIIFLLVSHRGHYIFMQKNQPVKWARYASPSKSCVTIIYSVIPYINQKNTWGFVVINIFLKEWVSDCCLTPTQQFLCYIMVRTS